MTYFNRRPEINNIIVDHFIKYNLQSFCSAACSYGAEVYDFIFKLKEKNINVSELKIVGCDIRKDIIESLNTKQYKYCTINLDVQKWSSVSVDYPYPVIIGADEFLYKQYFNENKVMDAQLSGIPKFFVHNINNKFTEKYDMVVGFAILTHLCNKPTFPFYGKEDRNHIFNVLNNLVSATNKLLVIGCPKTITVNGRNVPDMTRKFVNEFLLENNIEYSIIGGKFYFIYPNGIPKGI